MDSREELTSHLVQSCRNERAVRAYADLLAKLDRTNRYFMAGQSRIQMGSSEWSICNVADLATGSVNKSLELGGEEFHSATLAALVISACALQAYRGYTDVASQCDFYRRDDLFDRSRWGYETPGVVFEAERIFRGLEFPMSGSFSRIDLKALEKVFWRQVWDEGHETIVVTGTHAAGKTTLIKALINFATGCGIKTERRKFPADPGLASGDIQKILSGQLPKVSPIATQAMMWGNTLAGYPVNDDSALVVCDRHAATETPVYLPSDAPSRVSMFAMREGLDYGVWCFTLARHPFDCMSDLENRGAPRRIYESRLEDLAWAMSGYMGMKALPGMVIVDIDKDSDREGSPPELLIQEASAKLIKAVWAKGIFTRALVRQRVSSDRTSAEIFLKKRYSQWANGNPPYNREYN